MPIQTRPPAIAEFAQFKQFFADGRNICLFGTQGPTEGNGYRIWNLPWPFCKKPAALERKNRSPKLINPDGNYRSVSVTRDQLEPPPQTQQCSSAFELAFGKQTHDFARLEFLGGRANRRVGMPSIDGNATDQ